MTEQKPTKKTKVKFKRKVHLWKKHQMYITKTTTKKNVKNFFGLILENRVKILCANNLVLVCYWNL